MMRLFFLRSKISQALAWSAAVALAAPVAIAQQAVQPATPAGGTSNAPLAAVSGEEKSDCEMVTVKQGESAKVVDKKTPENGKDFVFLQSQDMLLEEFQIEEQEGCALAFGFFPGGAQAAAGGAAGATAGAGLGGTLAGVGIGTAVGLGITAAVVGGVVAATVSGSNNSSSTTSTVTNPSQN